VKQELREVNLSLAQTLFLSLAQTLLLGLAQTLLGQWILFTSYKYLIDKKAEHCSAFASINKYL